MPLCIVCDLQACEGVVHSSTNAPCIAPGLQVPETFVEDPVEAGGVWTVDDGSPMMHEDFEGMEFIFVAETADAEGLKPHTLTEAKHRPDWPSWEKAIKEELATLKTAGTWRLEEAPPRTNIISSKWVLKAKKDATGNVIQYKACLVAQGFSQIGGVNYDNTYTLVAKLASMYAVIAMANCLSMEMHQIDIKGAYLNGNSMQIRSFTCTTLQATRFPMLAHAFCASSRPFMGLSNLATGGTRSLQVFSSSLDSSSVPWIKQSITELSSSKASSPLW